MRSLIISLLLLTTGSSFAQQTEPRDRLERDMRSHYSSRAEELRREMQMQGMLTRPGQSRAIPLLEGSWDPVFPYDNSVTGGAIHAMLAVGDSLFIAGDFSRFRGYNTEHILLLNTRTGAVSSLGDGLSGVCYALAFHEGKLYAGGNFSYAGFNYVNGLAVYVDGEWSGIGMPNSTVVTLAIYQGKLVAGGYFTSIDQEAMLGIAMYDGEDWIDLDGGLQFSGGYAGSATELLVVGDSLFVGGDFSRAGGEVAYGIALWHNGWSALDQGITGDPDALAWYDGKLYLGGGWSNGSVSGVVSPGIITWNGGEYEAVGEGIDGYVGDLLVVGDALYACGKFLVADGRKAANIAKYANGKWEPISSGVYGRVNCLASIDGRVYVGGNFARAGGFNAESFAAIDHEQTAWLSGYTRGVTDNYNRLKVDALANSENYVYAGGAFLRAGGKIVSHIASWNKKTGLWSAMGGGVDGEVRSIVVRGNEVYVGGFFQRAGSVEASYIAKWDEVTQSWSALGEGSDLTIDAITIGPTGIYAPVFFDPVDLAYISNIGHWNGDTWEVIPGGIVGRVDGLHYSDGKLYMGGDIRELDGEPMYNIAVYENNSWSTLGEGIDGRPTAIVTAHGRVYAAGAIDGNYAEDIDGIMQFDGTSWSSLGEGVNDYSYGLSVHGNTLIVGGWFDEAGGQEIEWLAQWDGEQWGPIPGGVDHLVSTITSDKTSFYVGGYLGRAGGNNSWRIAKFDVESSSVHSLSDEGKQIVYDPRNSAVVLDEEHRFHLAVTYDLLGRKLEQRSIAPGPCRIDLSGQVSSPIVLHFIDEGGRSSSILLWR